MEQTASPISISIDELDLAIRQGRFPYLLDVRRSPRYDEAADTIRGARRRDPEQMPQWQHGMPADAAVVVFCVYGHEVSQGVATGLLRLGYDVAYLAGGIEAWRAMGLPLGAKPPASPGIWVTRQRPKIDRIACPWLLRRFIDPDAQILYVPSEDVAATAKKLGGTAFDMPGAEYGHHGEYCSFDAFLSRHGLGSNPGLALLARIVRGADTGQLNLAPQAAGLLAVSLGLSEKFQDDDTMLTVAMPVYDALYAWCSRTVSELPQAAR